MTAKRVQLLPRARRHLYNLLHHNRAGDSRNSSHHNTSSKGNPNLPSNRTGTNSPFNNQAGPSHRSSFNLHLHSPVGISRRKHNQHSSSRHNHQVGIHHPSHNNKAGVNSHQHGPDQMATTTAQYVVAS